MYAHIKGIVDSIQPDRAIIEANGVGYELICSRNTLGSLTVSKPAKLYTHFHFTQDSVSLFGFYTDGERSMFRKLIGISKVGPKVALSILSTMTVDDIVLAGDDLAKMRRLKGYLSREFKIKDLGASGEQNPRTTESANQNRPI